MDMSEEVFCYHCKKTFYLNSFRFREAKSVSCMYCGKRIYKDKSKKEKYRKVESFKDRELYIAVKEFDWNLPPIPRIKINVGDLIKFTGRVRDGGRFKRFPPKEINGRFEGNFIVHSRLAFKIFRLYRTREEL